MAAVLLLFPDFLSFLLLTRLPRDKHFQRSTLRSLTFADGDKISGHILKDRIAFKDLEAGDALLLKAGF